MIDLSRYPKGTRFRYDKEILTLNSAITEGASEFLDSKGNNLYFSPWTEKRLELVDYLILSKVGDRVVSSKYGYGFIHRISGDIFPISVAFESMPDAYLGYGFGHTKVDTLINLSLLEREGMDPIQRGVPTKSVETVRWIRILAPLPGRICARMEFCDSETPNSVQVRVSHGRDGSDPHLVCHECEKKDKRIAILLDKADEYKRRAGFSHFPQEDHDEAKEQRFQRGIRDVERRLAEEKE